MGITIHYQGQLEDPTRLPLLTAELQLACRRLDWPCHPVDERILGTAEHHSYHTDEEHTVHEYRDRAGGRPLARRHYRAAGV